MRKRFVPVYSVLVVAIVLLAIFVPSCGGPTTGTIEVKATLCGTPWQGPVNYTLTPAGGSATNGTVVPTTHSSMAPDTWTCAYVSGAPAGAFLNSIQPSASQSLVAGGTITFTFDFELDQDAGIQWVSWSRNGTSVGEPGQGVYEISDAAPCEIIDAHFKQWVDGCEGYNVTMNETSRLGIQETMAPLGAPPVMIVVVDDWCAVNKTPSPRQKVDQWLSKNGEPTHKGFNFTIEAGGPPAFLDVHTQWELVKGVYYTKAINWFGISTPFLFEQNGPHPCVLFELIFFVPGQYQFQMQTNAEVTLVGDTDVNPANNYTQSSPLFLTVNVPP